MVGCEKTASVWCLPPPPPPEATSARVGGEADTFLTKVRRYFIGGGSSNREGKKMAAKAPYQFGCCFFVLFMIFVCSSVGCFLMWFTDIYLDSILNQMTLKNGTEIFKAWKNPPVKPLICVHVFNYTNMDDYLSGKNPKIVVNDTGPYCYRETLEKTHVKFYDNGTVSYGDRRSHVFEERNSTGSKEDILIVPNLPLISTIAMAREYSGLVQMALIPYLRALNLKTMIRVPAHEFLFGYHDALITSFKFLQYLMSIEIPFEKFGILAMRAAETKERITVRTGSEDLNSIGVVTALNGESELSAWDDDECNRLDGSDGAFFPRHDINQSATLYLFHKDLCRKLPLVYEKDIDFQDGVMGMRFHVPPDVYNTSGSCYCKDGRCPPPGVFDVSPCANGAPMMMSFPHFMNADPSISARFEGIHPDVNKHDFFIDIQPILGFTLGTVSRIQLNVQIRKSSRIPMLSEFPEGTILPVVWFEVTADRLPPDLFNMIYHASETVPLIRWSLQLGFLATLIISGVALYLNRPRRRPIATKPNATGATTSPREVVESRLSSV